MSNAPQFTAVAATQGPKHHFFGYYGIQTFNQAGTHVLALESGFHDHMPTAGDAAVIGLAEIATRRFEPLAETRAWNLQQGSMLYWLPTAPDREIIYNDREGDRAVAVVLDIHTGKRRVLPHAIAALSHDGTKAICFNYGRLCAHRPVCSYAGVRDPFADQPHPQDDGLFLMDIATGGSKLIISLAEMYAFSGKRRDMRGQHLWWNHVVFNTDSTRFAGLIRWYPEGQRRWLTAMISANVDGSDMRCLIDYGYVSHLDWRDPQTILVWAEIPGQGRHYFYLNDVTGETEVLGGSVLTVDGHCSFSRDRRWILTDTYPDEESKRGLKLWDIANAREVLLGRFHSDPKYSEEIRCDLHPRWDREDCRVCFDSIHEGTRQVYVMDVSQVIGGS